VRRALQRWVPEYRSTDGLDEIASIRGVRDVELVPQSRVGFEGR